MNRRLPFPMAFLSHDCNAIRVNQAYLRTAGGAHDDYTGRNHFNLFPCDEHLLIFRHKAETGKTFSNRMIQLFQNLPVKGLKFHRQGVAPNVAVRGRAERCGNP